MKPWKSHSHSFQEALYYIRDRKDGKITSLVTPWEKVNKATLNGFEWQSTNIIAARPGVGKTIWKDQLIRESFILNPETKFRVLEFSLEMVGRVSALRTLSSIVAKPYNHLCNVGGSLTKSELKFCYEYAKRFTKLPIDVVDTPPTVKEFEQIILSYLKEHDYINTIITLDHSILLKKEKGQTVNDMLYELGETLTRIKKKYPVIFIVLSQLNRSVNQPERNENGKYGNYILDSDIFGADGLLQHCDTALGLNRPAKQKIMYYGPEKYIIENDNVLVMHILKSRNGDTGMAFFEAKYHEMKIVDAEVPKTK